MLNCKLNIESKHINTVNRTKKYNSTIMFLCSCQYLDKNVRTSCPAFSIILKILALVANHGTTLGWPSTWHNATDTQIRALDQPLSSPENAHPE